MKGDYYFAPLSCALVGMIALEAVGADYEPIRVDLSGGRVRLRKVNPAGTVPTLVTRSMVLTETLAIVDWLDGRGGDAGLLPRDPGRRALAFSNLAWFASTAHIIRRRFARPAHFSPDATVQLGIRAAAERPYLDVLRRVDGIASELDVEGAHRCLAVEAYILLFYIWGRLDGLLDNGLHACAAAAVGLAASSPGKRALAVQGDPRLADILPIEPRASGPKLLSKEGAFS